MSNKLPSKKWKRLTPKQKKMTHTKTKENGSDSPYQEEARKPKYIAYHDDPPCNVRLNPDGFCPACGFYPDMQSIALKENK